MGMMFYKSSAACRGSSESRDTKKHSDQIPSTCDAAVPLAGNITFLPAPVPLVPWLVQPSRSVCSSGTAFAPW